MAVTIQIVTSSSRIVTPDGVNGWGQITIYPNQPFTYVDGVTPYSVSAAAQQIAIADGQLQSALNLAPNTGATNVPETHYLAVIDVSGYKWVEYWQIDDADADPTEYTSVTRLTGPDSDETDIAEHVRQVNPHTQYMRFSDATAVQSGATVTDGGGKIARLDPATQKIPGTLIDTETTPITDAGNYFTADILEDALQELGPGNAAGGWVEGVISPVETPSAADTDQLNRIIDLKIEGSDDYGTLGQLDTAAHNGTELDCTTEVTTGLSDGQLLDGYFFAVDLAGVIYEYDYATKAYTGNSYTPTEVTGTLRGVFIIGTKMYVLDGSTGNPYIYAYTLGVSGRLSGTVTYDGNTTGRVDYSVATGIGVTNAQTYSLSGDGTGASLFITDLTSLTIYQIDVSTPGDLSTAAYSTYSVALAISGAHGHCWADGGTKLYVISQITDDIYESTLSVGYDLNSTYASTGRVYALDHVGSGGNFHGISCDADGGKLYAMNYTDQIAYEIDTTTTLAGKALAWVAGFSWTSAAASAGATNYGTGPIDETACDFRKSTAFVAAGHSKFQLRYDSGSNKYQLKTPIGTTWADFVVGDIMFAETGLLADAFIGKDLNGSDQLDFWRYDEGGIGADTGFNTFSGSIQIYSVRDL